MALHFIASIIARHLFQICKLSSQSDLLFPNSSISKVSLPETKIVSQEPLLFYIFYYNWFVKFQIIPTNWSTWIKNGVYYFYFPYLLWNKQIEDLSKDLHSSVQLIFHFAARLNAFFRSLDFSLVPDEHPRIQISKWLNLSLVNHCSKNYFALGFASQLNYCIYFKIHFSICYLEQWKTNQLIL
jgi:hypothetical protein